MNGPEEVPVELKDFNLDDVRSVYSGRHGCMCGCLGKHTYASKFQVEGGKERGYRVDDDEVSDTVVARIVKRIQGFIASGEAEKIFVSPKFFAVDTANRSYVIYWRNR